MIHLLFKDYDQLFEEAAARWEDVVTGDLNDATGVAGTDWFNDFFPSRMLPNGVYDGDVDDLVIGYAFLPGSYFASNRTLGSASAREWRPGTNLPISGTMIFNTDSSIGTRYTSTDVKALIIHEIGHILGAVSTSRTGRRCAPDCHASNGFNATWNGTACPRALEEYANLGLKTQVHGFPLLVQNITEPGMRYPGNACGHWHDCSLTIWPSIDDCYGNWNGVIAREIMSWSLRPGIESPLSTVTIALLEDFGYTVDYSAADPWPDEAFPDGSTPTRRLNTRHVPLVPDHIIDFSLMVHDDL